jgi:hypothetical protein
MVALAGAALTVATPSMAAITVTGTGDATTATVHSGDTLSSFMLTFDAESNGVVIPGVSSTLTLTLQSVSGGGTSYLFNYLVNNTSSVTSRVSVFGFDVAPNILSASSTGVFPTTSSGSLENHSLEVCFDSGNTNNCNSSTGGAGVTNGNSGQGTLTLNFSTAQSSIVLSNFLEKYQGIGPDGISAQGHPVPGVPEPATWALMLVGFGGIGMAMRRRRKDGRLLQVA